MEKSGGRHRVPGGGRGSSGHARDGLGAEWSCARLDHLNRMSVNGSTNAHGSQDLHVLSHRLQMRTRGKRGSHPVNFWMSTSMNACDDST